MSGRLESIYQPAYNVNQCNHPLREGLPLPESQKAVCVYICHTVKGTVIESCWADLRS